MVTHGMNVEEVRRLGRTLQMMSASIDELRNDLDRLVSRTTWIGPTAERFKYQWWPTNRTQLLGLSADIFGLGQAALNNANDQERVSGGGAAGGSLSSRGLASAGFLKWISDNSVIDGLRIVQSVAGLADDVKGAYYATMIGLSGIGMAVSRGDAAFQYFRSAKGGFSTQYGKLAGTAGAVVSGAINTADYSLAVYEHGWGSSEAASSAFLGTISTGASMVPGGGLAFAAGMAIGDLWYEKTPLGDQLETSVTGGFEQRLSSLSAASDAALASGNFDEALRLDQLAHEVQADMTAETSGYRGLLNSVVAVVKPF